MFKKDKRISFLVGLVSLFYWLGVLITPDFRLFNERGQPMGGLGIIVSIFGEMELVIVGALISAVFLLAVALSKRLIEMIANSLLFGLWLMLAGAYLIFCWYSRQIPPTLVLTIGYCYTLWIALTQTAKGGV